jgi:hypothetical protein
VLPVTSGERAPRFGYAPFAIALQLGRVLETEHTQPTLLQGVLPFC